MMKRGVLKILVFKPGESSQILEIEDEVTAMHGVVGGWIEIFGIGRPPGLREFVCVCNDNGKLMNLPPNRVMPNGNTIVGTFFIAAREMRGGEPDVVSLTEDEIAFLRMNLEPRMKTLTFQPSIDMKATFNGGPTTWVSEIGECDLCKKDLETEGTFVDGQMASGPWAKMCRQCHGYVGIGLGPGKGQKFTRQPDGAWVKDEG